MISSPRRSASLVALAALAGATAGAYWPASAPWLGWITTVFVRLLQMLAAPLVFCAVVEGVGGAISGVRARQTLARAVIIFFIATAAASAIGLMTAGLLRPGLALAAAGASPRPSAVAEAPQFVDQLVPTSLAAAFASNNLLGVVVCSLLIAVGVRLAGREADAFRAAAAGLGHALLLIIGRLVALVPLAVMGAVASAVALTGLDGLWPYAWLLIAAYVALGGFALLAWLVLSRLSGMSPIAAAKCLGDVGMVAFVTASGAAALPLALRRLGDCGVDRGVASFVLPLGYAFNLTGTATYLTLVVVTLAEAAGRPIDLPAALTIAGSVLVVIRGIPPVPRGLFIVLGPLLAQLHLTADSVALLLAIDPVIDMARTAVNVGVNCLAVMAVARESPGSSPSGGAAW